MCLRASECGGPALDRKPGIRKSIPSIRPERLSRRGVVYFFPRRGILDCLTPFRSATFKRTEFFEPRLSFFRSSRRTCGGRGDRVLRLARLGDSAERTEGIQQIVRPANEELIISFLAPCSGSLPWNRLTVATSVCLRRRQTNRLSGPPRSTGCPEQAARSSRHQFFRQVLRRRAYRVLPMSPGPLRSTGSLTDPSAARPFVLSGSCFFLAFRQDPSEVRK